MGMNATLLVFGPYRALQENDALAYGEDFYAGVGPDDEVAGILRTCDTSEQSRALAELLGLHPWALNTHKLEEDKIPGYKEPVLDWGSGTPAFDVYSAVKGLLEQGCAVWYMPRG